MSFKRISIVFVLISTLISCLNNIDGNGNVIKDQKVVDSFNKVNISGGFEVVLTQGTNEKLEIEADENLLELITTKNQDKKLIIKTKKSIGNAKSLKLYITVKELEKIDLSGAIELKNKGTLKSENLEIEVKGAGDIDLKLDVENLNMNISGASETTLSGKASHFEIDLSGASELDAKKLKTRNTSIDISGASNATVHAKNTLKVKVYGAGSVKYKGSPKITKNISGTGYVKKL